MLIRVLVGLVVVGVLLAVYALFISAPPPGNRAPASPPPAAFTPDVPPNFPSELSPTGEPTPGEPQLSLPPPEPRRIPTTFPADLPQPSPDLPPAEVVRTIVAALRDNDAPTPQSGVATTFNFASPANQSATGPLPRFIQMVNAPVYAPMINHRRAVFGKMAVDGTQARQLVTFYDDQSQPAYFAFALSQQPDGKLKGCWLTDGVIRLTPDQVTDERRKDPKLGL